MIEIIKLVNLAVAFFLETAMMVSFGYFGYYYPQNIMIKYVLVIGLPLSATILWGLLAAPKSKYRLPKLPRTIFALTLYGTSVFLLHTAGQTLLAAVFAIFMVFNQLLLFILGD